MEIKRQLFRLTFAVGINMMLTALSFPCQAQSKHAAIWYIGGFTFDFNTSPPTITKSEDREHDTDNWYIDENGKHVLTERQNRIYDEDMQPVGSVELENNTIYRGVFIESPADDSKVFYFDDNKCYLIDIASKTINELYVGCNIGAVSHTAVLHSECDKIWLIDAENEEWQEYLLYADNIKKIRTIKLSPDNYKYQPTDAKWWRINLSIDCRHYTLNNMSTNFSEVYYGDFDRATGLFTRKASFDFGNKYFKIYNSIIAPDNSRIYYIALTVEDHLQIFEIPIENGFPLFEQKNVVSDHKVHFNGYCGMHYGVDGKIYVLETARKLCSSLSVNEGNETDYKEIYNFGRLMLARFNNYLSSWFMDLPCYGAPPIDPCENKTASDIHFENSFVCHGDRLSVVCPNDGDYSFSYTYDGIENRVDNIRDGSVIIGELPGIYSITKVTSDGCEFVLQEPQTGEVGREIPTPTIIQEPGE